MTTPSERPTKAEVERVIDNPATLNSVDKWSLDDGEWLLEVAGIRLAKLVLEMDAALLLGAEQLEDYAQLHPERAVIPTVIAKGMRAAMLRDEGNEAQ